MLPGVPFGPERIPKGASEGPKGSPREHSRSERVPKDVFQRILLTFCLKNNPKFYENHSRNDDRPKHMDSVILNNTPMKMHVFPGLLVQKNTFLIIRRATGVLDPGDLDT